jgi:hypothetical protein
MLRHREKLAIGDTILHKQGCFVASKDSIEFPALAFSFIVFAFE